MQIPSGVAGGGVLSATAESVVVADRALIKGQLTLSHFSMGREIDQNGNPLIPCIPLTAAISPAWLAM